MYREKLSSFIRDTNTTLFLPKNGGLNEYVNNLLSEINSGELCLNLERVRGEDIPQRVMDSINKNQNAFGLTGDDLFDEFTLNNNGSRLCVFNTYDWFDENAEFKRPALCLMNTSGEYRSIPKKPRIAINKKYESTSRKFLKEKGIDSIVTVYSGDTEGTVKNKTNDCCIDIVYGGASRKENNLNVVDIIRFSDIVLIGKKKSYNPWEQEYNRIMSRRTNPTESYTSGLIQDQNELVKKFGQESAEFVQAFVKGENLVGEALDVFYATMIALANRDVLWKDVEKSLAERWKK